MKQTNEGATIASTAVDAIKDYLQEHYIEGIVFWKDGEPRCKIKRGDFGFKWN